MILSDREIQDRLVGSEEAIQAREWWKSGDWNKIGNRIVIEPFNSNALSPCCYDLSVGEEYVSLRDPRATKPLKEGEEFTISPGETVLVLTEEYVCLPRNLMAMVIPSARWIFEGTAMYSSRVEPTWYGKLLIAVTNLAKQPIAFRRGRGFCTCYFTEVSETRAVLSKKEVPHLGRTHVEVEFTHARPQPPVSPERVCRDDIEKVVDLYGWPWDVVRGMFVLSQKEITQYIEREVAPYVTEQAASAAEKRAFDQLLKWHRALIIGGLGLFGAFLALLGYLIHLLSSRP